VCLAREAGSLRREVARLQGVCGELKDQLRLETSARAELETVLEHCHPLAAFDGYSPLFRGDLLTTR